MSNRLSRLVALVVCLCAVLGSATHAQQPPFRLREGNFPPMITTSVEVERLFADIIRSARELPPGETFVKGEPTIRIFGETTGGLGTSRDVPAVNAADTLHQYLASHVHLKRLGLSYYDSRGYHQLAGLIHYPRVSAVSFTAVSSHERPFLGYSVSGYDSVLVDSIANRLEAFARTHEIWRTRERGEMIKSGLKVLALLLLPMAFALRERKAAWLLYPTSAALAAASYFIPFAALFGNALMVATR